MSAAIKILLKERVAVSDVPENTVGDLSLFAFDYVTLRESIPGSVSVFCYTPVVALVTASTILFLTLDSVTVAEEAVLTAYFHSALGVFGQATACRRTLRPELQSRASSASSAPTKIVPFLTTGEVYFFGGSNIV